jgi:hypothetical protein
MACLALIALLVITALIAGIAAGLMYAEIKSQAKRIKALEDSQAKHLPYMTAEEIENATASILTAKFKHDFHGELLDNALAHLQKARNGNQKN